MQLSLYIYIWESWRITAKHPFQNTESTWMISMSIADLSRCEAVEQLWS